MDDPRGHPEPALDPGTAAIVQLAWARSLGLNDRAFDTGSGRLERVDETATALTFVRLFDRSALIGPSAAVEAAAAYDDDRLAGESTLLDVSRGTPGRALGSATLHFGDGLIDVPDRDAGAISDEPSEAARLETCCPPDDVAEVTLSQMEHPFTLIADDGTVLAGAGFEVVEGILAHLAVLVAPAARRRGLGHYVSAIAADEAMSAGLVPQWRARAGHTGSRAIAAKLGLVESGSQTTVLLG